MSNNSDSIQWKTSLYSQVLNISFQYSKLKLTFTFFVAFKVKFLNKKILRIYVERTLMSIDNVNCKPFLCIKTNEVKSFSGFEIPQYYLHEIEENLKNVSGVRSLSCCRFEPALVFFLFLVVVSEGLIAPARFCQCRPGDYTVNMIHI